MTYKLAFLLLCMVGLVLLSFSNYGSDDRRIRISLGIVTIILFAAYFWKE